MIKRVINDFLITNTREYISPHILWETLKRVIPASSTSNCSPFCIVLDKLIKLIPRIINL